MLTRKYDKTFFNISLTCPAIVLNFRTTEAEMFPTNQTYSLFCLERGVNNGGLSLYKIKT